MQGYNRGRIRIDMRGKRTIFTRYDTTVTDYKVSANDNRAPAYQPAFAAA